MIYTEKGTYVAILSNLKFDGHYTKVFEYPGADALPMNDDVSSFFTKYIDLFAATDTEYYPVSIFTAMQVVRTPLHCTICRKFISVGGASITLTGGGDVPDFPVRFGICVDCLRSIQEEYKRYYGAHL